MSNAHIFWRDSGSDFPGMLGDRRVHRHATAQCLKLVSSIRATASDPFPWHSARGLLELVRPDHGLGDPAAEAELRDRIEAHGRLMNWPFALPVAPVDPRDHNWVILHHTLSTFLALAKSSGLVWLRERPLRLAPLQSASTTCSDDGGSHTVCWSTALWFPDGIPGDLLAKVGLAATGIRR